MIGAILALIGIRNLWYHSSHFLESANNTNKGYQGPSVPIRFPPDQLRRNCESPFTSHKIRQSNFLQVLILYVMNPPVSNAIQGAYLVAVFFSGITFGALAIVFKELTEGLGCFLGGFCASMWLLCLKPGGLLTDVNSKCGFIAGISVGFYALSFSQYTRPHGLIVSTAISGGTAVSLGIDCFSRAGLKEFWLYIWGKFIH